MYFPFKTRTICTVKTAKWASGIVLVVFFFLDFFWFFVVKQRTADEGVKNSACVFEDYFVKFLPLYRQIDSVLYSFGPFAIMGLANIAIIFKFIRAKVVNSRSRTQSTNQALSNAAMRGTAILITVTMTFIILTGPTNIIFVTKARVDVHPLLQSFLYIGVALNHSINGLLYTIVGSKFRKELTDMLCCTKRQPFEAKGGRVSNSSQVFHVDTDTTSQRN